MAQSGRGGPRTYRQRMCPDCVAPNWAPRYVRIQGTMLLPGDDVPTPFASTDWAEILEDPGVGQFLWQGAVDISGTPCNWSLAHTLAFTRPGIDWFFIVDDGGSGFSWMQWYYATHDHPTTHGVPLVGDEAFDFASPLGPVGAVCVNMRRWHEM